MTKIKNTKKGMAKKTLSMSLVVAMLATSNVPVWAAEFSDGPEAAVTTEAPATETFSDDAAEAPAVEDNTVENATATTTTMKDYESSEAVNITASGANASWKKNTLTANKPNGITNPETSRDIAVDADNGGSKNKENQKLAYQWYRDGQEIVSSNSAKYTLKKTDAGHSISVVVTETYDVKISNDATASCRDIYKSAAYKVSAYNIVQMDLNVGSNTFSNVNNEITVPFDELTKNATLGKDASGNTEITATSNIKVSGMDHAVDKAMSKLTYGDDYTIVLVGKPDSNGNQKAKIVFKGHYLWNGEKEFEFNVSDAKETLNNTQVTITTDKGATWDGQWDTKLKANLDTNLVKVGSTVTYQWQKCEKSDSVDPTDKANWKDVAATDGTVDKDPSLFTPGQSLVKNGTSNDGKDYLIRVKVTYTDSNGNEKTTYSAYTAVQPKSITVDDIILKKNDASHTVITTAMTITDAELKGMTVTPKQEPSRTLIKDTHYSVTGFDENATGVQKVSVVLTSPYAGKKIINVSNKLTDIKNLKDITLGKSVYTYNPEGFTPEVSEVKMGTKTLIAGTDYTVEKINSNVTEPEKQPEINGAPSGAAVSIKGVGAYTGIATPNTTFTKVNIVPEDLEKTCEVKVTTTTIPENETDFSKYVVVYYKTADGRKIELKNTAGADYTVVPSTNKLVPGEKITLKVVGKAKSATEFAKDQNFYGKLSADFTVEANDIFSDSTTVKNSSGLNITRGNALLGEIAKAIDGEVYMVNGSSLTKLSLDNAKSSRTFTGSEITFDGLKKLDHYVNSTNSSEDGIETLVAGHDYTVTYNNNVHAGTYDNNPAPSVTIKMIGKYKGERTFYFNIDQCDLGATPELVTAETSTPIVFNPLATDSTAKDVYAPADKLALTIANKGTKLVDGEDYNIDWIQWNKKDVKNPEGSFTFTVKAHQSRNMNNGKYFFDGDYKGSKKVTLKVLPKSLTSSDIKFADIDAQKWTGSASKPALVITDGTYTLVEGKDFEATWKNNVSVGNATVTVEGINGRYKDKLQKNFAISSKSISDGKIVNNYKASTKNDLSEYTAADSVLKNEMYNDGKDVKATFAVVDANNNKLEEGRDYTVEYKDNKNVGTATITITGKGSYEGTLTTTFKIVGELINGKFDKKVIADQVYTGNEIKPEVKFTPSPLKLEEGKDYEIVYVNNVNSYTATGKENLDAADYAGPYVVARGIGNYAGEIRLPFNIKAAELTNACATAADAEYAGGKIAEAKITVKNPVSGKELEEGKDYKVEYKSGVNVGDKGEAVITILDTKNYSVKGNADYTLTVNYNIVAKDLKDVTVNAIEDKTYNGSQITPAVTVMNGDVLLTPDADYTVSYGENKEVGNGTVTITAKGKNYKGTKEVTFKIVEAKLEVGAPMISDVKVVGNRATVILSGEAEGAAGYDYVISTDKDCITNKNYVSVNKNQVSTSTPFKYVQKGTYYAYCHAWTRDANGKKVFGEWSEGKKFKVTATTPDAPVITNVKVSGSTIKVTYKAAANATGYDVVLGTSSKKENGETRPYHYGDHKVLNLKEGTVTATFKNVPAGTWTVGMHAFNRTSENNRKVFSPWSNLKKATVK